MSVHSPARTKHENRLAPETPGRTRLVTDAYDLAGRAKAACLATELRGETETIAHVAARLQRADIAPVDLEVMSHYDDNPRGPDMPRGRPYSHQDDLAIIEAFTPRAERIKAVARNLGRTSAAVTRRYYRLLAEHASPESNVTGSSDHAEMDALRTQMHRLPRIR